jgi:site-specific recombinase XerD
MLMRPKRRQGARRLAPIMSFIGATPSVTASRFQPEHAVVAEPPADELALVLEFARAEKSRNSQRCYDSDFRLFSRWCTKRNLSPLPATPSTLAAFLASEAKRGSKASTITRRVAGIRHAHVRAGHQPPNQAEIVKATLRGIRRTLGAVPKRKEPLIAEYIQKLVRYVPDNLMGLRDRALLLIGFAAALRRSELVGLDVADLGWGNSGLRLRIRASKTDQEGQSATVAIAPGTRTCPITALEQWLKAAAIKEGPVFRQMLRGGRVHKNRLSDRAVAEIVKKYARRGKLDPALYSAHSLRAGFLTSAARRGASIFKMMDVSRHRDIGTLSGYVRDCEFFNDHAGTGLL